MALLRFRDLAGETYRLLPDLILRVVFLRFEAERWSLLQLLPDGQSVFAVEPVSVQEEAQVASLRALIDDHDPLKRLLGIFLVR